LCCVSSARLARPVTCTLSSAASISRLVVRRRTRTVSIKRDASRSGARASAACLPGLFHLSWICQIPLLAARFCNIS
jgi:hypothetical protein